MRRGADDQFVHGGSIGKPNAIFTEISKYQTPIHADLSNEMARKLVNFVRSDLNICRIQGCFSPIIEPRTRSSILLPKREQQVCALVDWFLQSNKPEGRLGEARQSGSSAVAAELAMSSKCASIF